MAKIMANRKARLGKEFPDWYDQAGKPGLPPFSAPGTVCERTILTPRTLYDASMATAAKSVIPSDKYDALNVPTAANTLLRMLLSYA